MRHHANVGNPEPAGRNLDKEPKQTEGLSQFIGKVLDQLSLSAWLPATMLVGCGAVLIQLRAQGNFDFGAAIIALTAKPLGILVVLLFALVLATMVSQAFSFSAIRFLEGYWAGPLIALGIYTVLVRHKVRKRRKLDERLEKRTKLAFAQAQLNMRAQKVPRYIVRIIEETEDPDDDDGNEWTSEQLADAEKVVWQTYCSPDALGRISHITEAMAEYPELHRIMPTRLGNVLRATEDVLSNDGTDIQGLVLRLGDSIPSRLRLHHDQFRTRLDMYCTLVFIHIILAALTVVLLVPARNPGIGVATVTAVFIVLAVTSYSAAVASARGYCATLRAIFIPAERPEPGSAVTPQ